MTLAVTLAPIDRTHARALFDALQDLSIYAFIDDAPPNDLAAYEKRCKEREDTHAPNGRDRWLNWVAFVGTRVAGHVQATVYPATVDAPVSAEFAYLFNNAFVGQGIAFEATSQMLRALKDEFGVSRVWVTVRKTNARSIALAERLGLRRVSPTQYPYDNFAADDIVLCGDL